MIRLLLEPCNLLILDEPTNHLDIPSKDVLKAALQDFNGTVVCVSHDRDFLDGLVSKVYEFGGGVVKEHLGGIYDFLRTRKIDSLQELEKKSPALNSTSAAPPTQASRSGVPSKEEGETEVPLTPHKRQPPQHGARKRNR